ncbi:lonely Cys domain-containing protein, partial [Streptomyces hebeiensis]|uniref:lonely Cys domain-containing protein n=1 Tax=Streptomyces hebeiensis TaxID=229486 RepID=UPI0031D5A25A
EWAKPGQPDPILKLIHVDQDGTIALHLPGGPPIEVSEDEFLELLSLDPPLRTRPLDTPVLFLTTGPGVLRPELVQRFSQGTGRPAYGYSGPLELTAADPSAPLTIVALPDPVTQAPGRWTKATRIPPNTSVPGPSSTAPAPTPAPAPAPAPAPVPPTPSATFAGASDPVLSPQTVIAGPSGARQGRNWTGKPVKQVLPGRVRVIETRPNTLAKIASEEDASWPEETYVVAANGDPGGLRLPDDRVLDTETLAKVLLADPELAKLPKNVPVLLAVPFAQRTLDLQVLSNLLGRPVVGPSGEGRLVGDGSGNAHLPALVDRDEKKAIGLWVPYEPLATTLPYVDREWTSLDGTKFRDSDVDMRPLVSEDHERYGQISIEDGAGDHLREFEQRFRKFRNMLRLVHKVPAGSGLQDGEIEELTADPAVYSFAAHGKPGRLTLALRDGRKVWLGKQDAARFIAGLREVRQLPPGHKLGLEICYSASDGDPLQDQPQAAPPPHIDDPWGDVPLGQYAANESRLETTSATVQTGMTPKDRVLFDPATGERGRRVTHLPEPLAHELDGLARDAGLHTGSGAVSA